MVISQSSDFVFAFPIIIANLLNQHMDHPGPGLAVGLEEAVEAATLVVAGSRLHAVADIAVQQRSGEVSADVEVD